MDGREVHRIEYEQCAEDARAAGARSWQVIYIFLGAIGVALTVVAAQLAGRPWQEHDGFSLGLAAVAAIVGSALAWAMKEISRRRAWVQRVIYERMRTIEWLLGMRKDIYVDILDRWPPSCADEDWHALAEDERTFLRDLYARLRRDRPRMLDLQVVTWLARLIIALWWLVFLAELVVVAWNLTHLDCG